MIARCLFCPILLVLMLLMPAPGHADDPPPKLTDAATPATIRATLAVAQPSKDAAPFQARILSDDDAALYAEIFRLQIDGKWRAADKLIDQIDNPVLMGHVLYQRYMHPTAYRSRYRELRGWMAKYADHPNADDLYRLARRRQGKARAPRRPVPETPPQPKISIQPQPEHGRTLEEHRHIKRFFYHIRRDTRRGLLARAERRFWAMARTDQLIPAELSQAYGHLILGYFYRGFDEKAAALADLGEQALAGAQRADRDFRLDWGGGLAAFRSDDCATAERRFSRLANDDEDRWVASGSAFWAARAALLCRHPERVDDYLRQAAGHKETFYGLIAARQLGIEPDFDWSVPQLRRTDYDVIADFPETARAIALAQAGWFDMADEELRLLWLRHRRDRADEISAPIIALSQQLGLAATQLRISKTYPAGDDDVSEAVKYPVPQYVPVGGFSLDRALLFGVMRQESAFRAAAHSHAGARGLMQVLPRTAAFVARDRNLRRRARYKLYDPAFNLQLGQGYLHYLEDHEATDANLFMIAAGYNAGPGNLQRWRRSNHYRDDPLLFIESMHLRETRLYVERVLANIWIYRIRFGQPTPSLDAVAAGAWPTYESFDAPDLRLVRGDLSTYAEHDDDGAN